MATKATLTIRQARVDEFDQVMDFYTKMIDEMRDTDFDVCWEHGVHPSPAFLRASVDAGEAYVGLVDAGADGAGEDRAPLIASAMVLNGEGDAGYEHAPWRVLVAGIAFAVQPARRPCASTRSPPTCAPRTSTNRAAS